MALRHERLMEQAAWIAQSELTPHARVEALMAEVGIFMDDGGPPHTPDEEMAVGEARLLTVLFLTPLTPTVRGYLHGLLDTLP